MENIALFYKIYLLGVFINLIIFGLIKPQNKYEIVGSLIMSLFSWVTILGIIIGGVFKYLNGGDDGNNQGGENDGGLGFSGQ